LSLGEENPGSADEGNAGVLGKTSTEIHAGKKETAGARQALRATRRNPYGR